MKKFGSWSEQPSTKFRTSGDNKEVTLTVPATLAGASLTLTTPSVPSGTTDRLISRISSDTAANRIQNKEFSDDNCYFVDSADTTKKLALNAFNITTGTTRTWTFPDADDTVVGLAVTQSLTNKTITDASNNLSATILTVGSVPDARVPASNVTQHEGSIAINNLSGTLGIAKGGTGQTAKTAAFDALAPTTTKGDINAHNGTNNIRLAVGTDGQVLTADSAQASGLTWTSPLTNPMDSVGDLIIGGGGGAAAKLDSGGANTILVNATANTVSWSDTPQTVGMVQLDYQVIKSENTSSYTVDADESMTHSYMEVATATTVTINGKLGVIESITVNGTGTLTINGDCKIV